MGSKKQEDEHFCFCIGLRIGFIITSLAWLIEGLILAIVFYILWSNNNALSYKPLTILIFFYSIILMLLSGFGLISYRSDKSISLLRTYKYAAWLIAVFVNTVLVILFVISHTILERNQSSVSTQTTDTIVVWIVMFAILQIAFHAYFAMVVQTFVNRQEERQKRQTREFRKRRTVSFSKPQRHLSVKIDKSYDMDQDI